VTPLATLEKSQKLDAFLAQAITELKPKPMTNKFIELAEKIKSSNATMNDEADKLSAEVDAVMPEFMSAVEIHRGMLRDARDGVKAMKDAANTLSNFGPNEHG
jgi:pantoate kinase